MPRSDAPRGTITAAFLRSVDDGHLLHVQRDGARYALNWMTGERCSDVVRRAAKAGLIVRNAAGVAYELTGAGRRRLAASTDRSEATQS